MIRLIFLIFGFGINTLIGQTYTVTTTATGVNNGNNTGSLDQMLILARNEANNNASNVVLEFNVQTTTTLVPTPNTLQELDHTAGSITIRSAPGAQNQGISGPYGFKFTSNNADLTIEGLTFQDVAYQVSGVSYGAINYFPLQSSPTTSINTGVLTIRENTFIDCGFALNAPNVNNIGQVNFQLNSIQVNSPNQGSGIRVVFRIGGESQQSCELNIEGNDFNYVRASTPPFFYNSAVGISILNYERTVLMQGIVNIRNYTGGATPISNTFNGFNIGIDISRPKSSWEISNNIFNTLEYGIRFVSVASASYPPITSYSYNFIENVENEGNSFLNTSTSIESRLVGEVLVKDYSLKGSISAFGAKSVEAENCLISIPFGAGTTPITTFTPIRHHNTGNGLINSPAPTNAELFGSDLHVSYDLNGYLNTNGPFRVEFYFASPDNSFLEFIGDETYVTAPMGSYTKVFNNIVITDPATSKVAITITSLANNASDKLGTSEVGYINLDINRCNSFNLGSNEKYWLSGWVNVDYASQMITYERPNITESPSIEVEMLGAGITQKFYPTGEIIDGWQRVIGSFTIAQGTVAFGIQLNADVSEETYFDDIRIHPFNGSMKSYVYDPETYWLTAELDDNNYATFYEYDNEGDLIRIKKETSRGVVTIQETRSNTVKKQ